MLIALPDAAQGNFATVNSMFFSFASISVSPHHAISGSVKTTAELLWPEECFFAGNYFYSSSSFV
ncbi:MAG: hypothetical protein R3A12_02910 [Ignavibacteria bacterium]